VREDSAAEQGIVRLPGGLEREQQGLAGLFGVAEAEELACCWPGFPVRRNSPSAE
jgi:hypothetical protein